MTQQLNSWAFMSKKWKLNSQENLHTNTHSSFLDNSPKLERSNSPSACPWWNCGICPHHGMLLSKTREARAGARTSWIPRELDCLKTDNPKGSQAAGFSLYHILEMTKSSSWATYQGKGNTGCLCFISYNCMWLCNYLEIKSLIKKEKLIKGMLF